MWPLPWLNNYLTALWNIFNWTIFFNTPEQLTQMQQCYVEQVGNVFSTVKEVHKYNVEIISQFYKLNKHSRYLRLLKLVICMCILYFSFLVLVFVFLCFLPESSLAQTAYNEHEFRCYIKIPWHCRILFTLYPMYLLQSSLSIISWRTN